MAHLQGIFVARAPETGFYFEPIAERLALVVEGSPFPSDDHWAWLGDPIKMTPEQAKLLVCVRWPGLEPDDLDVEFDLNFERAVEAKEQDDLERKAGILRRPLEFDVDIDQLLAQAELLRDQVRAISVSTPSSQASEAAQEAEHLRNLMERARELTVPHVPGQAIRVPEAKPQSEALIHGDAIRAREAAEAPIPIDEEFIPALVPLARPKPRQPTAFPPARTLQAVPAPPAPATPETKSGDPKPEGKGPPRRPNIRDKR